MDFLESVMGTSPLVAHKETTALVGDTARRGLGVHILCYEPAVGTATYPNGETQDEGDIIQRKNKPKMEDVEGCHTHPTGVLRHDPMHLYAPEKVSNHALSVAYSS
jgi:hypothetical protein